MKINNKKYMKNKNIHTNRNVLTFIKLYVVSSFDRRGHGNVLENNAAFSNLFDDIISE